MAVYKLARFVVRPEAREQAERTLHELASSVRRDLPNASTTTYRETHVPNRYLTYMRDGAADTERAFSAALQPFLDGEIDFIEYQLVTSSDLAPRHREPKPGARRRPR